VIRKILGAAIVATGYGSVERSPREREYLVKLRGEANARHITDTSQRFVRFLEHTKSQYDDYVAGRRPDPPIIDFLIVSGGGDWGAFGAGFLKGWGGIPNTDALARPEFGIVTGVSTGALIAPFAFLGDAQSYEQIVHLYRNPHPDWVRQRGYLYFLPNNISFAEVPGLERELRSIVTLEMATRLAGAEKSGRMLVVNTTNLDDASPRVFHLVSEAQRAIQTRDLSRMHNIMLASAGIPGAFPYREIEGEMYVDGAVTANIIYGGRVGEEDSLPAVWQRLYPDLPIPRLRYWVVFNNQLHAPPTVVRARWFDIITRSMEQATRSGSLMDIRHLFAMAEVSRLKRKADVEVRIVAIPDDWSPPVAGIFVKETMNDLADLGEMMGADPSSWSMQPPPPWI
jgi:hypothetical protein